MLYKLKYENERGQEVVFGINGYSFVDTFGTSNTNISNGYSVVRFEGFGDVEADLQLQKAPYQDGSTHIDTLLNERPLYIEFAISANDYKELSEMRRYIGRVFNPKLKGKLTMTSSGKTYEIGCSPEHVPNFPDKGSDVVGTRLTGSIDLLAPDPYWTSTRVTEEPAFEPKFHFPFVGPFVMGVQRTDRVIDNDGDAPMPIQVDFYGPADSPMIANETTGKFIRINKRLEENEIFRIDTTDGVKSVIYIDEDGNEENVFHWIDINSTFFKLGLGENEITCNCALSNNQKDFDIYYKKLYNAV